MSNVPSNPRGVDAPDQPQGGTGKHDLLHNTDTLAFYRDETRRLRAELATARAALGEAQKDAERYRLLDEYNAQPFSDDGGMTCVIINGNVYKGMNLSHALDAAIRAAIRRKS